jgi:hypothetical protein
MVRSPGWRGDPHGDGGERKPDAERGLEEEARERDGVHTRVMLGHVHDHLEEQRGERNARAVAPVREHGEKRDDREHDCGGVVLGDPVVCTQRNVHEDGQDEGDVHDGARERAREHKPERREEEAGARHEEEEVDRVSGARLRQQPGAAYEASGRLLVQRKLCARRAAPDTSTEAVLLAKVVENIAAEAGESEELEDEEDEENGVVEALLGPEAAVRVRVLLVRIAVSVGVVVVPGLRRRRVRRGVARVGGGRGHGDVAALWRVLAAAGPGVVRVV